MTVKGFHNRREAVTTCLTCTWADRYDHLAHRLDRALEEREALQQALTRALAEAGKARAELERALADTDLADDARVVYDHWREVIGDGSRRLKFSAKRSKAVQARLNEGYTVDDLKRAVDGAKIGAYVDDRGVRHDDLELICRDAPKVRRFIAIAQADERRCRNEADQLRAALAYLCGPTAFRESHGNELWPCPICGDLEAPDAPQTLGIAPDGHAHCWACQHERHHLIAEADRQIRLRRLAA